MQSIAPNPGPIAIAKGFAILYNPMNTDTFNEDYRQIVSVAEIPLQSRGWLDLNYNVCTFTM